MISYVGAYTQAANVASAAVDAVAQTLTLAYIQISPAVPPNHQTPDEAPVPYTCTMLFVPC